MSFKFTLTSFYFSTKENRGVFSTGNFIVPQPSTLQFISATYLPFVNLLKHYRITKMFCKIGIDINFSFKSTPTLILVRRIFSQIYAQAVKESYHTFD